jgi:hypothetical protein
MDGAVEHAGNLADAVGRVRGRASADRVAVDDGLQHEAVVGVQPERDLPLARPRVGALHAGERRQVAIEFRAIAPERPVVDVPVADVEVEQLIEGVMKGVLGRENRDQRHRGERNGPAHVSLRNVSREIDGAPG